MPNHVLNEVVFTADRAEQKKLLAKICNAEGQIDFEVLLPLPLNIWKGDVGAEHEKNFPGDCLHWATENWGTKWNAYSHRPIEATGKLLTLRFETAWSCPHGWLLAVFNYFKQPFVYHYLSEDDDGGHTGTFSRNGSGAQSVNQWSETKAAADVYERLRQEHFGDREVA